MMSGLWGTISTFSGGRYFGKWPRKLATGLTVGFGDPLMGREATAEALRSSWRQLAQDNFEERSFSQKSFADSGRLLCDELPSWRSAVRELQAMNGEEFQALARHAAELAQVAFWNRGEKILLEWDAQDPVCRVLGILLPPLVGAKVTLVERGASEGEILQAAVTDQVTWAVFLGAEGKGALMAALRKERVKIQVLEEFLAKKPAFDGENGVFPIMVRAGEVVTWAMDHPNEESVTAMFQPGWKAGSVGRLLPAAEVPEGWEADEEDFLFPSAQ